MRLCEEVLPVQKQSLLRDRGGLWPLVAVSAYVFGGYFAGLGLLLFADHPVSLAVGTLLTAHAMVIAAYLLHECGHNTLFRRNEHNAGLGRALNWICASAYARFEDIRNKHMRHHVDNTDVVAFDHVAFLRRHPRVRRVIEMLEWAYVPALPVMMHWTQILLPFAWEGRRHLRGRVVTVAVIRGTLFLSVLAWNPRAAILYVVAWFLMLHALRFMDAFQHNYALSFTLETGGEPARRGDSDYEQSHTFSNPVSLKRPWLNLVTLNFGYHNAHHARPTVPWYRLPALHRELFPDDHGQVLGFTEQLSAYHRHRVQRVMGDYADPEVFRERLRRGEAAGADAVSFLTPI
jgi:acyl-lipid omega-6 desaturase (Delta-12 desaturase)